MKLRVEVDRVVASVTLDSAWTPELLGTLLRHCGDEVIRVCESLALESEGEEAAEGLDGDDG